MRNARQLFITAAFAVVIAVGAVSAQTTAFTFQGTLNNASAPATGSYDFEFALFDAVSGGAQVGATLPRNGVAVANGIFTVSLDFGAQFSGANRFLEIRVRQTGGGAFTTLTPRQQVVSTPYSIRSLNATNADALSASCNGCVTAAQIGTVNGSDIVGTIPVASIPAGSGSYVQNGTTQQATSNFNISGTGTGNIFDAATQYNLGGTRVLSVLGTNNLFAGKNAGIANSGIRNTIVGDSAGPANTSGLDNAFFGFGAGFANTSGAQNTFVGSQAGRDNTTASNNSMFGYGAGAQNTTGINNSFFGSVAGLVNSTGQRNSFFGTQAGNANTTGGENAFFGFGAGFLNTTANGNSFFGSLAGRNTTSGGNSFFGSNAGLANTTGNQNAFFGYNSGTANNTGFRNSFFGDSAGIANTSGVDNTFVGANAGLATTVGTGNVFIGSGAGDSNTGGAGNTAIGNASDLVVGTSNSTAIGARAMVTANNSMVLGSINGVNGAVANTKVGIGTTGPIADLHVQTGGTNGGRIHIGSTISGPEEKIITFGDSGCSGSPCVYIAERAVDDRMELRAGSYKFLNGDVTFDGSVGVGFTPTSAAKFYVLTNNATQPALIADNLNPGGVAATFIGNVELQAGLAAGGVDSVCLSTFPDKLLAQCSSSLRYKKDVNPFGGGLNLIKQLRPISYAWKSDDRPDVGFGAEDIAKIDPRFVTYNQKGEVEGVKYDRFSVLFVNAFKEQQQQIDEQRALIERQRTELAALKALVCKQNKTAAICQPKE